ncbi:hypothetical protein F7725_019297, partial [Dissostichus mawsoni]
MLNPPAQVQKQWDSLNLSQIILTPTRYDTKNPEKATLLDVILTNNPDRYKTGVFCSDLSDHCLIGCIRYSSTGNERIAELFNQHFVKCGNLFDSIAPPKPPTNTPPPSPSSAAPCHSFCLQEVSEND